jgi:hypothetical protein
MNVPLPDGFHDPYPERGPWKPVDEPLLDASLYPVSILLNDGTTTIAKCSRGVWHGWDSRMGKLSVLQPIAWRSIPPITRPHYAHVAASASDGVRAASPMVPARGSPLR